MGLGKRPGQVQFRLSICINGSYLAGRANAGDQYCAGEPTSHGFQGKELLRRLSQSVERAASILVIRLESQGRIEVAGSLGDITHVEIKYTGVVVVHRLCGLSFHGLG